MKEKKEKSLSEELKKKRNKLIKEGVVTKEEMEEWRKFIKEGVVADITRTGVEHLISEVKKKEREASMMEKIKRWLGIK